MANWETLAQMFGASSPELGRALADIYAVGRARWSSLPPLAPSDFAAHLALHLPPDTEAIAYLRSLVVEDLYLACACLHDLPGAMATLDQQFLQRIPAFVSHIDASPSFADEVRQLLSERLLVRRPDGPPRIADYGGRGALASWLRVAAVRVALNLRAQPAEARRVDDEAALAELAVETTPELELLRARHAEDFAASLRQAITLLAPEQRVLLRMYFASGESTERIASALRVNRSTAARRLVAARQAVFDETRRLLREKLRLPDSDFTSLARALHDQLDISLGSILASAPPQSK